MTIPQRLKPIASPDYTTRMATDSYDKSSMFSAEAILRAAFKPINYGKITLSTPKSIEIYGSGEPACTIDVHNPRCFKRALFGGSVGIGESYMDGDWEVDHLVNLIRIFANERNDYDNLLSWASKIRFLVVPWTRWRQRNSTSGSRSNIHAHYDLGNEFFQLFLDNRMMYSCANFDDPHASLEQASEQKLERVCQKLQLHKDDHLLEIGTGWGGLAIYATTKTGCRVTTTTISKKQYEHTSNLVQELGLADKITVLCEDYRQLTGTYSKVVSIEMVEAVGHRYMNKFFAMCRKLLAPNGLLLLQAIVIQESRYKSALRDVDFIKKYIFPGGFMPSISLLTNSAARAQLSALSLEDFGRDYAQTLHHWADRFRKNRAAVLALGFDDRFIRMWEFYFAYCQGGFMERAISDIHILFGPDGWRGNATRSCLELGN